MIELEERDDVSGARLVAIAFGVAGTALFLGGAAAIMASRRPGWKAETVSDA